jgi:DNA-binding NtrC family response regulator
MVDSGTYHARKMNSVAQSAPSPDDRETVAMEKTAAPSILIVDDEENFLALLRWFLSNHGFEVETASNGEDALKLAETRSFTSALVDIKMQPIDGLTLLDELRQRFPVIKVVLMTAFPTVVTIKQSFEKGASGFLTKPVNLQELLKIIDELS